MPIYEYYCKTCKTVREHYLSNYNNLKTKTCPECKGKTTRTPSTISKTADKWKVA